MEAVDVAPLSVQVRAVIVEVSHTNDSARSISGLLSLFSGRVSANFGASVGGNSLTFANATITAVLSALDDVSEMCMIAEPSVRVVHGRPARLVVGAQEPIRGTTQVDNNGNTIQSIEYRTAGVQLVVTPQIYDDVVVLEVAQEISGFSMTTTSGIDSPTLQTRSVSTTVDLRDGGVVAISGLDELRESGTRSGFMGLPLGKTRRESRSQIVVLLEAVRPVDPAPAEERILASAEN